MLSLIIDTSTDGHLAALAQDKEVLRSTTIPKTPQQSKLLLPTILSLLENFSLREVEQIAIGIGPGSFTGTRCGIMVAKSLAFGLGIPVMPFDSLSLFYLPEPFLVVNDAKGGKLYLSEGASFPLFHKKTTLCNITDFHSNLALVSPRGFSFQGSTEKDPNPSILAQRLKTLPKLHPHDVEASYLRNP